MKFKSLILVAIFASVAFPLTYNLTGSTSTSSSTLESGLWPSNYRTIPSTVESGDKNVILIVDFQHFGSRTYQDLSLEAKFTDPFEPVKPNFSIDKINPRDIYTVSFRFNVKDTDPGIFAVPIEVRYYDTQAGSYNKIIRTIYIQVSAIPRLELTRIETGPSPKVGEEFSIFFHVQNIGDLPSSEITASITSNASAFITWIPSQQNIKNILPGSEEIILFRGTVSSKTEPNAYAGALSLAYSTETLSNIFVVDIDGEPEMKLAGVSTDVDEVCSGQKFSLSIQIENTGSGDARSVKMYTDDQNVKGLKETFVGTIEKDDTGTGILDVFIDKTGNYQIPITIEYEDTLGEKKTMTAMATLYIYPSGADSTGIIVVIFIIFIAGFWYLRKKKKIKLLEKI